LALAARYPDQIPIFAAEAVLDEAGIVFDEEDEESQIEEFREFLNQVRPEDFTLEEGS
jgi:bifunctional DNase/RNase